MEILRYILYLISMIISGICIWLPIKGAGGFFAEFKILYTEKLYWKLLLNQLPGPILILVSSVILCAVTKKNRKWLITGIIASMGSAAITTESVGLAGHDFGHVIFQECSDIYTTVIATLSLAAAGSMLIATMYDYLRFRQQEKQTLISAMTVAHPSKIAENSNDP